MTSTFRTRLLGAAALSALAFMGGSAGAQTTETDTQATTPSNAETIVVTARRRSESLKDVPAQVTAFTSQTIENKGITMPRDFLNAVPGATLVETQNSGNAFIVIRGITQARNSEPSVAVVVDGVEQTQPAEFNQELADIQQIEVLKGPQGALYGRNAIGGAILITTKQPTDRWEGHVTAGYESGPGGKAQGVISGPITDNLLMRGSVSYFNTVGHLDNVTLHQHADPVQDINARLRFVFKPTDEFTADLRLSTDLLRTKALYFTIDDFGDPNFNNPNDTHYPISNNNPGKNNRNLYNAALKLSWANEHGTFTSTTAYAITREILTGDGYPFDPFGMSRIFFDFNQSQFLDVKVWTQELRFTSPQNGRFRWIAGGQAFGTKRFISTGNELDTGAGVIPIYREPSTDPAHFSISYLADSQSQFAWAGYIDTSTEITDQLELSLNLRYDYDHRENTTKTPTSFLTAAGIPGAFGDIRTNAWDDWQPQAILRYAVTPDINLYASYSRGFRSGGFNQTGVATAATAAGFTGVGDLFNQETADTFEGGIKSQWLDGRVSFNGSVFKTIGRGSYYFVFLASNSTQNLGNINKVEYLGFDADLTANIIDGLTVNVGYGYTDSRIKAFPDPAVIDSRAPLVPLYTFNTSAQYLAPVANGIDALFRVDYNRIGDMFFTIPLPLATDPTPVARDPIDIVDARIGLQGETWSATLWSKNLFDEKYNAEYSPGGFMFRGAPMRWGIDFTKRF